ncbi:MAG TPA: alanine racemase [Candidatus Latescibacteria bacterium]|nr:alanine racemase [Candidatus Latescibacterota bacterium]
MRPTYIEIDLSAIRRNLEEVRQAVGPERRILAPVKANAYGHGMLQVARTALEAGASMLGVAYLDEAVALRQAGIGAPILIFGSELPENAPEIVHWGLRATLCTYELAKALSQAAVRLRRNAVVHVKVDTGMGRIGLKVEEIREFLSKVSELPGIVVEGIYTHFATADGSGDGEFALAQMEHFRRVVGQLRKEGMELPIAHAANSAAVLRFPSAHLDMVRPGIMLYGLEPFPGASYLADIRPAMSLKSRIVFLKEIPPGASVSYGRTFVAGKRTRIATVPIGYGDGYPRALSNRGKALVRGKRARIVGNICMDQLMLDVTHIEGVRVGDEVVLIGGQGDERITAEELASLAGTINYEIVTSLNGRIPRIYKNGSAGL